MAFTTEQLRRFADLIRLDISDERLEQMNVESVIEWLDELKKIDTTGVKPLLSVAQLSPELNYSVRDDIVVENVSRDELLENTPDKTGVARGYFSVPKVKD
ncbi:MAG: Asp-tRNA(Asn)/Glu-tRNA(Gln) amidotransferase subunit GatC [Rickettsiales bacterium]|jgi:aspartyl-tRNA(Asn)/glutamyl-tRNA(Gln) amidotransferase subunit C|nr:Asp-tRNA(Asn)/Glu-tRNA(Gln) amidotransferase subunit GatC [Rickettsiales bacterium]